MVELALNAPRAASALVNVVGMARIDDRATKVCADKRVTQARHARLRCHDRPSCLRFLREKVGFIERF